MEDDRACDLAVDYARGIWSRALDPVRILSDVVDRGQMDIAAFVRTEAVERVEVVEIQGLRHALQRREVDLRARALHKSVDVRRPVRVLGMEPDLGRCFAGGSRVSTARRLRHDGMAADGRCD